MNCSGIKEVTIGIMPCQKVIDPKTAITLDFVRQNQIHNLLFCNFGCLATWLKYSYWENLEGKIKEGK